MRKAVIVSAVRTPVGKARKGALKDTRPEDMGKVVIQELLKRSPGVKPEMIDDVIIGCAMPEAEQGMNLARIVALYAGLPDSVPGMTVNRFCSSGVETIAIAAQRVMLGWNDIVIAGGIETMTKIPMGGNKIVAHPEIVDKMVGVYTPMGHTAENVVERFGKEYNITREEMDKFALRSHQKAIAAQEAGKFDEEIVPMPYYEFSADGKTKVLKLLTKDEGPRKDTSLEVLAKLKPAFKAGGSVTAGNSSQMNDGAAAVLVMSEEKAKELGLEILGYFENYQVAGVDPEVMGIGPAFAIPKLLEKTGLTLDDIDLIELNEAFASQSLYVIRKLGLDESKVNVNGGAIALGHPLGCTGAKLTCTLLYEMKRRNAKYGIVTMCIGGGMGAAALYRRA